MHNRIFKILFVLLLTCSLSAEGQKLVNSPYSRFNLGRLEQEGSFRSSGMGGTGVALRDNTSIQFANPASYSSFDTLSFLFDYGIDYSRNFLSDGASATYKSDDVNFHHLILGFPLSRNWGFAIGVVPFSNGYYSVTEQVVEGDPGYDPLTGGIIGNHKGSGGYNTFFMGTGTNVTKNLSVGVNVNVLFGAIERINQVTLMADDYLFNNNYNEKLSLRGINFDYGIQYMAQLKNDYFFNAGISYTMGKNYRSNFSKLNFRYSDFFYMLPYSPDTLSYESIKNGKVLLPQSLKLGIAFGKKDVFVATIDYLTTTWSKSDIPGAADYITDSKSLRLGMEYTPKKYSNYGYLNRVDYRLGGHMGNDYIIINGYQLKEYGATLGFGFPMLGTVSKTNVYFDYTKRFGSTDSSLPRENLYSVGISVNLYDYWFLKRKYN